MTQLFKPGFAVALLAALFLAACSAAPPKEVTRFLWPPPPDTPRLEFLKNYYTADDLPKTDAQKAMETVVGKPPLRYFERPFGIASDGKGKVYISDPLRRNVSIFDFVQNKSSDLLSNVGLLEGPFGLAVDSAGRLFVADNLKQKVVVFSPAGEPLFVFGDEKLFDKPTNLAINERLGRIYVSDSVGNRVVVFDLNGNYLFSFGKTGTGEGELYGAMGIAIARDNTVYVAEQLNTRISAFDADGKFLRYFGKRGSLEVNFEGPRGVAIDSDGNLHIVDVRKGALIIYRPDGKLLLYVGGKPSAKELNFRFPTSIWIDGDDRVYIADGLNKRFGIWQYISEAALADGRFGVKQ